MCFIRVGYLVPSALQALNMAYTQKVCRNVDEKSCGISRPMIAFVQIKYSFWIGYFSTWEKGPIHPDFDWTRSLKWKLYRNSLNYCLSIIRYITSSNVLVGPRQDTWESAPGLLDQHQVRLKCTQQIKLHNNY